MTRRLSGVSAAALVAALILVGCSSGDAKGPTATVAARSSTERTTTTTKPLTPEQEVEAAYLKSWDVYAKAMRTLDPSGLEASYGGEQLKRTTADVSAHREREAAVRVHVVHDYTVEVVAEDLAVVRDRYRNHSVLIDPKSANPTEPDPDELLFETYTLKELGGRWKVVDIVREQ